MKIWTSFGGEHSANLVLIGHFDTANDAKKAVDLIQQLEIIQLNHPSSSSEFSKEMLDFAMSSNFANINRSDTDALTYEHQGPAQRGSDVVITTEETSIEVFVKAFLHFGGRVEIYSAHDHPNTEFGRGNRL